MRRWYAKPCTVLLGALALGACADPGTDASASPPQETRVVRVLDRDSRLPVAGATVEAEGSSFTTDADGRVSVKAPGSLDLHVGTADFVPAQWFGLDAEEIEVVLRRLPNQASARVQVEVGLSESLPAPAPQHYWQVQVLHALSADLERAGPGLSPTPTQTATCHVETAEALSSCALALEVPAGLKRLYALVTDVDTHGTDASDDDTAQVARLFISDAVEVGQGSVVPRVLLRPLSDDAVQRVRLNVSGPAGAGNIAVVGVPGVNVADGSGVLLLPTINDETLLPARTADFDQSSYWLVAEARYIDDAGDEVALRAMRRRLESDDFSLMSWPDPPARPELAAELLRLAPVSPFTLHELRVFDAEGAPLMDALWVGDLSELPLPAALHGRVARVEVRDLDVDLIADQRFDLLSLRSQARAEAARSAKF